MKTVHLFSPIIVLLAINIACCDKKSAVDNSFCNPLNISYRFALDSPSRREAADPMILFYKNVYYLFASKSGGYWYSDNLLHWTFIESNSIPAEEYAPTTIAIGDTIYFLASSGTKSTIYKTSDPMSGKWTVAKDSLPFPVWDPAFFMDDDNRLYLYWGCSNINPIYGIELDYKNNFNLIGRPVALFASNQEKHGWENPGDYNELVDRAAWIEGAWMNKHKGKYYLQYAGPGTEFKSYSDGVYVSDKPLGPFTPAKNNPFSSKPEGFIAGAGHGGTFYDKYGNYWHIATITISVKHMFERRIALFPAFFDNDGEMYAATAYGDYPMIVPQKKISSPEEVYTGWMLLSYGKKVTVSSFIDTLPGYYAADEDIRTYWASDSPHTEEWMITDLENICYVYAIQVNFAEHNTRIFGRHDSIYYQYLIESSSDGKKWYVLTDKTRNTADTPHDYIVLQKPVKCRYLKLTVSHVPDGHVAISDFRIFGKGNGKKPDAVSGFSVKRKIDDKRTAELSWNKVHAATGYTIRYGIDKNKLYQHYQVYADTSVVIRNLNAGLNYYFTIESFNENGITKSKVIMAAE